MVKNYKLIVINNKTQSNFSFSINSFIAYVLYCFLAVILFFFFVGIFRFFNPHEKKIAMDEMYAFRYNMDDLLNDLYIKGNIDSTLMKKYNLHENYFQLLPNNPPVEGMVTKGILLNESPPHNGIDIATKIQSEVKAAQDGMVIFSNPLNDYGNTIILAHPNGYYSIYSHLERCIPSERDYVTANQDIGYAGETGNSNGPHLHFEIWKNHHIIDPRQLIKEYKIKDVSIR
jgi:murein DD-endopeptidase MepM/ murein hydrolase activator NlpD